MTFGIHERGFVCPGSESSRVPSPSALPRGGPITVQAQAGALESATGSVMGQRPPRADHGVRGVWTSGEPR